MGLFDSFKKKEELPKPVSPQEAPLQQPQNIPELPSMPTEAPSKPPQEVDSGQYLAPPGTGMSMPENMDLPEMSEQEQTSFEVPDFSEEDLDFESDKPLPEDMPMELPEEEPEEDLGEIPMFQLKPQRATPIQPVAKDIDSLKKEVFSEEHIEKPDIFIEKKRYGRLLLSEGRLLDNANQLIVFIDKMYGFLKDEIEISNSLNKDLMDIQKDLMSIDTELFEKEDAK
jgi:hypothetical protein